jgi:hypothetical protein
MLQDRVNNQLTVMVGVTELRGTEAGLPGFDEVDTAMAAAQQVARELEGLSMQSLRQWEHTYGAHLPTPLR